MSEGPLDPKSCRVAFIGVGAMGEPMATNLLRHGVDLTVVAHRRRDPVERLVQLGAREAATAAQAAQQADVVVLMLPASAEVETVIFGAHGTAESIRRGAVVVDCSTSDPAGTRSVAARLRAMGVGLVDAPVSRGVAGARAGKLAFFLGGSEEDVERVQPLLALMGNEFHPMGPVGAGHVTKLVHNLVSLSTVPLVAEALAIGRAAGLEAEDLLRALLAGSANSSILASHGPRILQRRFDPGFTIDLARKDLALALALASQCSLPSFVGAVAGQAYNAAAAAGHGSHDVAAVHSWLFH